MDVLSQLVLILTEEKVLSSIFISGDFNINFNINSNTTRRMKYIMNSYNLKQTINANEHVLIQSVSPIINELIFPGLGWWSSLFLIQSVSPIINELIFPGLGWWSSLSQLLDIQLRGISIIPRHYFMIEPNASQEQIEDKLRIMKKTVCRAVILCLPANDLGHRILRAIDKLQIAFIHNTVTILMDVSALPSWTHLFHPELGTNYTTGTPPLNLTTNLTESVEGHRSDLDISFSTKTYILIVSEVESDNIFFNDTDCYIVESEVLRNLKRSLNSPAANDFVFVLLDIRDDDTFRPLLSVTVGNRTEYYLARIAGNIEEWNVKHIQSDECENCDADFAKLLSVLAILVCSSVSVVVIFGVAALARYQLLKKRVSKGPYKVLLTATDFVFPQIADSRRVDEGIEAMLCCWLQQLQEFGGPEVDKPDLLQGSGGCNTRTPLRGGSSPSLAKQLIVDPRVRYNGDLVQMKPVPCESGGVELRAKTVELLVLLHGGVELRAKTVELLVLLQPCESGGVELRAKTVELLVLLHGLRHENLNPLIGCLAEPPRAALVSEWCARGSLQDVLQQDDIKLDWSFRLSLLTDLVRGMKYLHSTPIRVHGYLTSRNSVIDARWVLKVTDYGLPAFYEAQGITPPQKSARGFNSIAYKALLNRKRIAVDGTGTVTPQQPEEERDAAGRCVFFRNYHARSRR
ncbi:Protein tyrosine and serine/threonine kinase [Popillia japonica]|uniref:guanylate cyclase n=1 Tax=Popillia japonica TaxID=7064 RepID=A0AAW1IS67_POPJA